MIEKEPSNITEELTSFNEKFSSYDYPLLVISPRFPNQEIKPLYDRCESFSFPSFVQKH